jgi:hypothetical protein
MMMAGIVVVVLDVDDGIVVVVYLDCVGVCVIAVDGVVVGIVV